MDKQKESYLKRFKKLPLSCRFYRGYVIRNHGYYPPDKCVWWEAYNEQTGEADFHAKRLRDIIRMINESLDLPTIDTK